MPGKKKVAGSVVASEKSAKRSRKTGVAEVRTVAAMIEQIEAMFSVDKSAPSCREEMENAGRERPLCHVSISYVRSRAASSIEIFWRESAGRETRSASRLIDNRRRLRKIDK